MWNLKFYSYVESSGNKFKYRWLTTLRKVNYTLLVLCAVFIIVYLYIGSALLKIYSIIFLFQMVIYVSDSSDDRFSVFYYVCDVAFTKLCGKSVSNPDDMN